MKPIIAVLALLSVQECGLFSPSVHSTTTGAGEGQDGGGFPYLSIVEPTCWPALILEDAGTQFLPWDGGELPLLDSGIQQWHYEFPNCDMERLRAITAAAPGVGLGIDAPSDELRTSARLMVGEWTGSRTTRWDGAHPVTIIFFESGHYSTATGDCVSPTYYGAACGDHVSSWRLDTGNSVQAEGELGFENPWNSALGVMWMKQVRVRENHLTFNLWHGDYGPIEYQLVRVTTTSCAGKNLAACP